MLHCTPTRAARHAGHQNHAQTRDCSTHQQLPSGSLKGILTVLKGPATLNTVLNDTQVSDETPNKSDSA